MKKVEIGDFAKIAKLGSLTLSPSETKAAFTVTRGKEDYSGYASEIWVYDSNREPALFRLTPGDSDKNPLFENEDTIIFASDREKKHPATPLEQFTVYNRVHLSGGEIEEAFVLPFSVTKIEPLRNGLWLCGGTRDITLPDPSDLSAEEKEALLQNLEKEKDYAVFDELPFWFNGKGVINKKRTGLFLYDSKAGTTTLLTEPHFDLEGFTLSEDRSHAAYWGTSFTTLNSLKSSLFIRDLSTGRVLEVNTEGRYTVSDAFYANGKLLVLATDGACYGTSENDALYLVGLGGTFTLLSRPDTTFGGVGSDIAGSGSRYSAPDGLYTLRTVGFRSEYIKIDCEGNILPLACEPGIINAAVGRGSRIFLIGMEKDAPQELYVRDGERLTKLSSFNEAYMAEHETARTEHFAFTDRDGIEIDGWVLYPEGFDPALTYPGILTVHGGPRSVYGEGWFHEMQYFAGLGYIVFFCNPRGSSGKGDAFADILGENFGVRDYNDIMEFTDEVLRRVPQLDPTRLGMTGGSYGGFMANWIIGHTDRFRAVVSCRSISNYFSKCLTTDIGYYHNLSQIGTDPWKDPALMWSHSPLAYADKAVTPTLFIQSDEDYRCWMGDAVQMLQALLMHGVPARMCLFHGENHELSRSGKPEHRVRRLREMADWFAAYLSEK